MADCIHNNRAWHRALIGRSVITSYSIHYTKLYEKVFKLLPEYRIFSGGQEIAFIKKEFTFLKPKINITSTYGNFTIDGNMIGYNFNISKDGKVV